MARCSVIAEVEGEHTEQEINDLLELIDEFDVDEWINDHVKTNARSKYVLSADINESEFKDEILEWLEENEWTVDTHLGPKRTRTGWKKAL